MPNPNTSLVLQLVTEEVRRIVADAIAEGGSIRSGDIAAAIAAAYPNCGLTNEDIANEVILAASRAGIAVEMNRLPMSRTG